MRKSMLFSLSLPGLLLVGLLAGLPLGCGKDGGGDEGETANDGAEFAEAVPDTEMLALTLSDEDTQGAALTVETLEQGLETNPALVQARAQEIVARVNAAVAHTKDVLTKLFADVEPTIPQGRPRCRVWEADGEQAHWRMTICAVNRALKHFGFTLHGRPLASTEEGDYLLAIAGAGKVLPRHEGKRRGVGRIGYDFDNIHTLRGTGPTGKLGFGYRAAGRARQLNIGLRELVIDGADQAISALYRFTHVLGRGGRLAFTVNADFVKKEGEQLVKGQDGQAELGRAVLVWVRAGAARAVAAICGGTVGEGTCVRIRECWRANGELSFEELAAEDAAARWEETACPAERDLPLPVDEPPAEDELQVPADGGEAPGPAVEQPGELPDLE